MGQGPSNGPAFIPPGLRVERAAPSFQASDTCVRSTFPPYGAEIFTFRRTYALLLSCDKAYKVRWQKSVCIRAGVFSSAMTGTPWQKYSDIYYSCIRARM